MGATNGMPSDLPAEDSPFLYQICLALVVDLKRGSAAERQADVVACWSCLGLF
jgi:hypothetical protein